MQKCTHPDHIEGQSCADRTISCHKDCECCIPIKPIGQYSPANDGSGAYWVRKSYAQQEFIYTEASDLPDSLFDCLIGATGQNCLGYDNIEDALTALQVGYQRMCSAVNV